MTRNNMVNDNLMIDPASVAFDVDGVFADTMTLFLDIARDDYHLTELRYEDIKYYSLEECLGIDKEIVEAIITKILDGNHATPLKPIDGAAEVLTRLGRQYSPLLFVTARPYKGPICDWMQKHLPLDPAMIEVIPTGSFEDKTDVLLDKGISYFVEDKLETCFLIKEAGITPILFIQPWNREKHPFTEVADWKELESLIAF